MEDIQKILSKVEAKFPALKQAGEQKIIDGVLCLSCYVENNSNYFILYPNGEIKYRTSDHWEYTSGFNKEGFGNGVAFIDLSTYDSIKVFYYKDDLNYDDHVRLTHSSNNFIVTEHEERTHIIFLNNFSISSFGGWEYKIYDPYILFFPHSGYSTYDTFAIIDTNTKRRVDLSQKLKKIIEGDTYNKEVGWFFEQSITIDNENNNLVYQYQHSGEVFNFSLDKLFLDNENLQYVKSISNPKIHFQNLQQIEGEWNQGISIDMHTIKSTLNTDGSFNTERSYIGELLYQIKYRFDKTKVTELAELIANAIEGYFKREIDILIPIPPSNLNRPFQPLNEIAKELSVKTKIPVDLNYLQKNKETPAIKQIENNEERKKLLHGVFKISNNQYQGKSILLFDDLYRSGETLNEAARVLKEQGKVSNIFVLTITKTRTKK